MKSHFSAALAALFDETNEQTNAIFIIEGERKRRMAVTEKTRKQ
jgi:hypothetical protein